MEDGPFSLPLALLAAGQRRLEVPRYGPLLQKNKRKSGKSKKVTMCLQLIQSKLPFVVLVKIERDKIICDFALQVWQIDLQHN
jgi:hypothetical protein